MRHELYEYLVSSAPNSYQRFVFNFFFILARLEKKIFSKMCRKKKTKILSGFKRKIQSVNNIYINFFLALAYYYWNSYIVFLEKPVVASITQ